MRAKFFSVVLAAFVAVFLAQAQQMGGPRPSLTQQREQQRVTQPQPEAARPGAAEQTGRQALGPSPGVDESTARSAAPGCRFSDERTGRGGEVCRPAGTLPRVGTPERPTTRLPELGPQRPTGPQPGDYPRAFPPYGTTTGGPPPPYGPGLGGRTVGP